jgi:hypothetical protein
VRIDFKNLRICCLSPISQIAILAEIIEGILEHDFSKIAVTHSFFWMRACGTDVLATKLSAVFSPMRPSRLRAIFICPQFET